MICRKTRQVLALESRDIASRNKSIKVDRMTILRDRFCTRHISNHERRGLINVEIQNFRHLIQAVGDLSIA